MCLQAVEMRNMSTYTSIQTFHAACQLNIEAALVRLACSACAEENIPALGTWFRDDSRVACFVTGTIVASGAVGGILGGGFVISKMSANPRALARTCAICSLVAAACSCAYFFRCDETKVAGIHMSYNHTSFPRWAASLCTWTMGEEEDITSETKIEQAYSWSKKQAISALSARIQKIKKMNKKKLWNGFRSQTNSVNALYFGEYLALSQSFIDWFLNFVVQRQQWGKISADWWMQRWLRLSDLHFLTCLWPRWRHVFLGLSRWMWLCGYWPG